MSKLRKTSDGRMPIKAALIAEKQKGAVSITVSSTEGWCKGERQDFVLCKYDTDKKVIPGSVTTWTGVPGSNNTIDSLELTGGNDQLYPIGSSVVAGPTSRWADDLIDAMLEHHDEEGRLKEKTVALNNINGGPSAGVLQVDDNGTVTSGKIKASNIDLASLNKYSTEERVIGQWIDGRPIYRKLITGTVNLGQNSSTDFPHNITGLTNNMRVISCSFAISFGGRLNNGFQSLLPHVEAQHQCGITIINQTIIRLSSSYPWGNSEIAGFIEYVK